MNDLEGLARQVQRQARALEQLVEQLTSASLPLTMSKVRAARELDVSVSTLQRLISAGTIKLTRHGKVPASELLRYAAIDGKPPAPSKAAKYSGREEAEKLRKWRVP